MTLIAPLALVLLAIAIPIVLMYVLRLRRPIRTISSTLLWPRLVGDMQANAPWQRLRPSALLAAQLLVLLALVFALAGPAYSEHSIISRDIILVIDESYSMQAHDVAPSRFAAARGRALTYVSELAPGSVMSVIGMGRQPHLAIAESQNGESIRRSLSSLRPESSNANVLASLSLAVSLARHGEPTKAIVLTDHTSGLTALPLAVPFPVDIIRFGGISQDFGITSFEARGGNHTRAVLRVRNRGTNRATSDVQLYADGQLADVRTLTAVPGAETTATWDDLPAGIHRLRVRLTRRDDMDADKQAWAVVSNLQQRRVLLVTAGNYFLQTSLRLEPSVHLATIPPSEYSQARVRGSDLVVFDAYVPHRLPAVPTLLVAPPHAIAGIRLGTERPIQSESLAAASGQRASPLLRYVDLADVHVARAPTISLPAWMRPVATAGKTTILAEGLNASQRVALITFRLEESDWPLQVSFPVLIRNLVDDLAPNAIVETTNLTSAQPAVLVPPAGTTEIRITRPDGSSAVLSSPFPPFDGTSQAGIYQVHLVPGSQGAALFAVNAFAPDRTDQAGPSTVHLGGPGANGVHRISVQNHVDWALAVLALGLLCVEWWIAFGR